MPAITHVDYSARIQTVSAGNNQRFYKLLGAFERRTGCPVLVNTSFNVRGEPPVCTPEDAYRCFMRTDMDYLVLGNFLIDKAATPRDASTTGNLKPPRVDESRSTLRRFGLTTGIAFLFLGSLLDFRHRAAGRPFQSLAFFLLLFAGFAPGLLRFVYRPWMRLAKFLGTVSSSILLAVLFFFAVTPIGWLQRLFGKRPLDLRFKNGGASYWQSRSTQPARPDYERQF